MEFITKYSESVREGTKEVNLSPSMTEPDNSMSIPEIIARFTRGQGLQVPVHKWVSGSASEDGTSVSDAELDTFLEIPKDPEFDTKQVPSPDAKTDSAPDQGEDGK